MPNFRIHPAFGVARVGDSNGPGILGPEQPGVPANWDFGTGAFNRFKDSDGRIKRQGVRFRVFEYDDAGNVTGEVLPGQHGISAIEWTVEVANRKAAFFKFRGHLGEDGDFSQNGARNDQVRGTARIDLEIAPGPKTVSGRKVPPVVLANAAARTKNGIPDLGDISTDDDGRLLFFGGHGRTHQESGAADIANYVNNDGWFDDVSDGRVSAVVVRDDGSRVPAAGAWVSVGPPDFAPSIANVVSLYDTMWDVAVREQSVPIPDLAAFRAGGALERLVIQRNDWDSAHNCFRTYLPEYATEIADLLRRAFSATSVHYPPDIVGRPFHQTIDSSMWKTLGDPDPRFDVLRRVVFNRMRDPDAPHADSNKMPRGLGDQYCDEGDELPGSPARDNSKRFFSLTRVQYAILARWADGKFAPGLGPPAMPTAAANVTPDGLDRAALENCVGGPFFPGIEVSWTVRNNSIYAEPFRVCPGVRIAAGDPAIGIGDVVTGPGFFSQQMALPWQADFRDCKRERLDKIPPPSDGEQQDTWAMWWAGQRPDDVFPEDTPTQQVSWTRGPHFTAGDDVDARFKEMVENWSTLGFITKQDGDRWLETERKP